MAHAQLPPADTVPWGVAPSAGSWRNHAEWFPKMAEAGGAWVRLFPEWRSIEPAKGQWKWDGLDAMLKTARENQLQVAGILMGCTPWSKDGSHAYPMNNLGDWSDFVSATVERYKKQVHTWEVWNEPNGSFNDHRNTTADYAALVAATYAAAKKSDPNAQVGMTVASYDPAYLLRAAEAMAKSGKPDSFDYLCIHPYELGDALSDPDGEIPFLWMSKLLRDALRACSPVRANADLWISEIGRKLQHGKAGATEQDAAKSLVKFYTMAAAQGIKRTLWFEARDPYGEEDGFGLIEREGQPRAAYHTFKTMTATLGATPKYLGWFPLGSAGRGYGFVFKGATSSVLVAWMPAGEADRIATFGGDVSVLDSLSGSSATLKDGELLALTDTPVFITRLPADLVAQAKANAAKSFPWGGDYATAKSVSLAMGTQPANDGVTKRGTKSDSLFTFPDGTSGVYIGDNRGASFYTHPSFATLATSNYYVRLTLRRIGPGNVGMNFNYERADTKGTYPYKNTGIWFSLPPGTGWQTHTWHVTDACFAKMFGYDFAFAPEQSVPFAIGKVEVSLNPFTPP